MNQGTRPYRTKRKDYDYVRSFHPQLYAGVTTLSQELQQKIGTDQFPAEYLTDKTGWLPDQNAEGRPFACTSYTTVKLARILGFLEANVEAQEAVTHANQLGGFGVLAAIDAARKVLGWFSWRFTIQSTGKMDSFETFRLAQVSGLPEQRAISWGTPWFASWEAAVQRGEKIMPMPTAAELAQAHSNPNSLEWHNHVLDGWSQNFTVSLGQLLYRDASHQGPKIDYLYFTRDVINVVQDLYGTVAITVTSSKPPAFASVPLPSWFWDFMNSWMGLWY